MTVSRTIELIAPSGYPQDEDAVRRAFQWMQDAGHEVRNAQATTRRFQRFAGTDDERAADLNRFADPSTPLPDVILAVRGGYGAVRILPALDYEGLQRRFAGRPVPIVGHSDFTAIQMALYAQAGIASFGGPMFTTNFGVETPNALAIDDFFSTLSRAESVVQSDAPQQAQIDVSGTLWGGNLAVLSALAGTPYMPQIDGGILYLEDVNEQPYRLERMFYQLHLAGVLGRQRAIVLGDFAGAKSFDYDNGFDLDSVIAQLRATVDVPVVTGLRFGHIPDLTTLPFGAAARLVANAHGFTLVVSGYPHIR